MENSILSYSQIEDFIKSYRYKEVISKNKIKNNFSLDLKSSEKFSNELMIQLLDYTYLSDAITAEKMLGIVSSVSTPVSVAGLCVTAATVPTAREVLNRFNSQIKLVSVAGGFPKNIEDITKMLLDVELALQNRSDEIDIVLDTTSFLKGNYRYCAEKIRKSSELCHSFNAKLKVILEISELESTEQIAKASMLCILSGADFIKTSTGYTAKGADYESVATMCNVINSWYVKTGVKVGIKPSGGIDSLEKYNNYLFIIKSILGDSWLNADLTRIGASKIFLQLTSSEGGSSVYDETAVNY